MDFFTHLHIRGIVLYVCFEFTVPLKAYSEVLIFLIVIHVVEVIPHCCQQHRKLFGVIAHSAEKLLAFLPTTRKRTLISVLVCFSGLLPT
jgi:hypothetical protein